MSIPSLASYSVNQIDELKKFSSVWQRYFDLTTKVNISAKNTPLDVQLRCLRHQAWLQCVAAEYFQTASTKAICFFWSQIAIDLINQAFAAAKADFPDLNAALFAFGKLGVKELNLSSDVDLMLVADNESSQQQVFLRQLQTLLAQPTEFGFVFRCDFDLRPGGRMGPLIPTVEQLKDYYGNYGEAWERLAFIRLQAICGSTEIIHDVNEFGKKFIYRKHLDYTLLSDLKNLRQRIHTQNWHRSADDKIDLKLGVGGIRDLELFTHTLLVVHGGKDSSLRISTTDQALELIGQKNILPEAEAQFLIQHYWHLRHLENLVQAQNDEQTHILNASFPLKINREDLQKDLQHCDQLVSTLLGHVDQMEKSLPENFDEQIQWLISLGFQEKKITEIWPDLISTSVLSRQKERDELYRKRFLYLFLQQLATSPNKHQALLHLRDFLKSTRAKATFYSLFLSHQELIAKLVQIFATSPYLSQVLCQRPELIDSFVLRSQAELDVSDPSEVLSQLLEKKSLSELITGADFLVDQSLAQLMARASSTADEVMRVLLTSLTKEYGSHHVDILCLGKWGGQELGLKSDLDFICITINEASSEPQEFDMKIARRLLNRLTENHQRGGALYSVDLRLRPQEQTGMIVTSFDQLIDYLSTHAQVWERQAYLRARFLFHPELSKKVHAACVARPLVRADLIELARIRTQLLKSSLDLKYNGGGLVDLELAVQSAILHEQILISGSSFYEHVESLRSWAPEDRKQFIDSWRLMRQVEQLYQALSAESASILSSESQAFVLTAEILKCSPSELFHQLQQTLQTNLMLLKRLDPRLRLS